MSIFIKLPYNYDYKRACSSGARAHGYELWCRGFKSLLAQIFTKEFVDSPIG